MFYYLNGTLTVLGLNHAVIDIGGAGYKLTISQTTHDSIHLNTQTKLFTYLAVREDDIELFGFASETELNTFKMLITISGVGPKAAIAILSIMTPEEFAMAVLTENTKAISKANGVGAKTAARVVLELKDKLAKSSEGSVAPTLSAVASTGGNASASRGKMSEAIDALMVLGYSRSEALTILKDVDIDKLPLEEIIRTALKKMKKN